jgi:hypothetical protein
MGADRRNPDGTRQLVVGHRAPGMATKVGLSPPAATQRLTPPLPKAGGRPPPPPTRGMAFSRTLPQSPTRAELPTVPNMLAAAQSPPVEQSREPAVVHGPAVESAPVPAPAVAQEPAVVQEPAVTHEPAVAHELAVAPQPTVVHAPASSVESLEVAPAVAPRRRVRTKSIVVITAAACLGLVAAALFGHQGKRQAPSTRAEPATVKVLSTATPAPNALPADVGVQARAIAVVEPASPVASIPLSGFSAPSCREMLGSSYAEKLDLAGAFAQTQLGKSELVRGNVAQAQEAFCKASLWDGKNVERWLNLAQLFLLRRDGAQAAECARAALALRPDSSRALTTAGDAWAILGKLKEAREAYLGAEQRTEPDREALQLMIRRDLEEANRMVKARDFARAERVFRRVVVFDSENAAASSGVAQCLVKLGDKELAEAWERRAETLKGR